MDGQGDTAKEDHQSYRQLYDDEGENRGNEVEEEDEEEEEEEKEEKYKDGDEHAFVSIYNLFS